MGETSHFFISITYCDPEHARHSFYTHKLVLSVAEVCLLTNQYMYEIDLFGPAVSAIS